jgi:CDP-glucose 4,6-dehydratase
MRALALDSSLARTSLGWRDYLKEQAGIAWTAEWYRAFDAGANLRAVSLEQIAAYRKTAAEPR